MSFGSVNVAAPLGSEAQDEVIATFDVFHSTSLEEQLHIFQYPLRSLERPYESMETRLLVTQGVASAAALGNIHEESSTSPTDSAPSVAALRNFDGTQVQPTSRMTMHCTLDTYRSPSFACPESDALRDPSAVEQGRPYGGHCYRYVLQSTPVVPRSEYAVGVFVDNQIHLTTVSSVQQFTPTVRKVEGGLYKPVDMGALRVEDACVSLPAETPAQAASSTSSGPDVPVFTPGRGNTLAALYAIPDRARREMMRQRSVMLNVDADLSKELHFHPLHTVESSSMRQRLKSVSVASGEPAHVNHRSSTAQRQWASEVEDALFPHEQGLAAPSEDGAGARASSPDRQPTATVPKEVLRRYASQHSVFEQVAMLIASCHLAPLQLLLECIKVPFGAAALVSDGASPSNRAQVAPSAVLDALRQCAVLVHGVWVAKQVEAFKYGVGAAIREFVLLRFTESTDGTISRAELNNVLLVHRHREIAKSVLETIAEINNHERDPTKRRWRLRYVFEDSDAQQARIGELRSRYPHELAYQQTMWARRSRYICANMELLASGKPLRPLMLATGDVEQRQGAHSLQSLPSQPPRPGHEYASPLSAPPSAAGTTSRLGVPSEEVSVRLVRDFVHQLFIEHGVINKQRAKEIVLKAREQHFPGASNQTLGSVMQSMVHQFTAATWVLKVLGEPEVDRYRPYILRSALELNTFETKPLLALAVGKMKEDGKCPSDPFSAAQDPLSVASAVKTEHGDDDTKLIPQRVVSRILAEIAEYKAKERLWHIKSGNV